MSLDFDLHKDDKLVFQCNITHNVSSMWQKAGCYEALYLSEGKIAINILPSIEGAICDMALNRKSYKAMDPPNGWGSYELALEFLQYVYEACTKFPTTIIEIHK